MGAIELNVDETGRQNAAAEVNNLIWGQVKAVEGLLILEDLAGQRVNP